ncbi:hypothetical protein DTL21_07780 [Bremerella cremea]|uniref:Uncharacterized protein n=1 Tax=Blastopirellula marina TaxID=124 RepID=A0A2S8G0P2_9BACT|nr:MULTISPECIES: ThiF family adenylyltransferase [Pirellulaceae]PQO37831.1 hypothetical protein C5Y83_07775 [Blastopirellula marina]RCS50219.1 hypothetical protein DTL21_07780 [Bremerella cremea]
MRVAKVPSDIMREGRRYLDSIPEVRILQDFTRFTTEQLWGLCCRVSLPNIATNLIASDTDWWITFDDDFPHSPISVRPAVKNGISLTFPHQRYNGNTYSTLPWRSGHICVHDPTFIFRQNSLDVDPIGQPSRLAWYVQRTIEWLKAASSSSLMRPGDPFEFPDFPGESRNRYTIAHGETEDSLLQWTKIENRVGVAELVAADTKPHLEYVIRKFVTLRSETVLSYAWGSKISKETRAIRPAIWLRCEDMPITLPYQAIDTWGELIAFLETQGRLSDFRNALESIRDGGSHFLLLGFPIPSRVDGMSCQMHWQPLALPALSFGDKPRRGFRANSTGHWRQDRYENLRDSKRINWQIAEDWSWKSTSARGRLDSSLSKPKALLIGAGAVGSVVAETLVRCGNSKVVVCDKEGLDNGNLCRHTLDITMVGVGKAKALAQKLNRMHSHAEAWEISEAFPPEKRENRTLIADCDLVLDCTGDNLTLQQLARFNWRRVRSFCSISLSYGAKRIYVYTARSNSFPVEDFHYQFKEWAEVDLREFSDEELVLPNVGCWHPAFPARFDNVSMLVMAAIRRLEEAVTNMETSPRLVVFEQQYNGEVFTGIVRK